MVFSKYRKNGAPSIAVTIPTGRPLGGKIAREARSASTVRIAPAIADEGIRSLWSGPNIPAANMWHNKPHKADDSTNGNRRRRYQRRYRDYYDLEVLGLQTQVPRGLLTHSEDIEVPCKCKKGHQPEYRKRRRNSGIAHESPIEKLPNSHAIILPWKSPGLPAASASTKLSSAHRNEPTTIPASRKECTDTPPAGPGQRVYNAHGPDREHKRDHRYAVAPEKPSEPDSVAIPAPSAAPEETPTV